MITVIGSLKGGSGKSTTSFNLAIWLLTQKTDVVIFDLDPQQTLTDAAEFRNEDGFEPTLTTINQDKVDGDLVKAIKQAGKDHAEVMIDIGNSDMDAVNAAMQAADRIIVPVLPSQSDVWSLQRFLKNLKKLKTKKDLSIECFINRADTHYAVLETIETIEVLQSLPGIEFIKCMLGQRTGFRRSFSEGLGVFELEPRSKAAAEFLLLAMTLYPNIKSRRRR